MTDRESWYRAMAVVPEDDVVRLAFADWLDERGDPASAALASLIRLQCQIATYDGEYYLGFDNCDLCRRSADPLIRQSADLLHAAFPALVGRSVLDQWWHSTDYIPWRLRRGAYDYVDVVDLDRACDWLPQLGPSLRLVRKLDVRVDPHAFALRQTTLVGLEIDIMPPLPAWSTWWCWQQRCDDSRYWTSRNHPRKELFDRLTQGTLDQQGPRRVYDRVEVAIQDMKSALLDYGLTVTVSV